jgi:hypothetical protein
MQTPNISTSTILPHTACTVPWRRTNIVIVTPATSSISSIAMDSLYSRTRTHLKVLVGAVVLDIKTLASVLTVLCGFVLLAALVDDDAGNDTEN